MSKHDSGPATVDERRGREAADTEPVATGEAAPSGKLPDRYAVADELARGGMGRVVVATDRVLGRVVAVKEALHEDAEALRRFARETRITARLEHPSIVPVYDAGVTATGTPFYVMRKVGGRPLDKIVSAATTLEQRLALLPHVLAATQAVAHAHERGIIHRDLKPTNILVGSLGETIVIDWGLAKVVGETDEQSHISAASQPSAGESLRTRVGTVFGTPGFMSPEQLRSADVDERADVYALGATLYYMLAREPPHAAPSGDEMMTAAMSAPPLPIARHVRGVPAELSTIVDKALAYDLGARYPTAKALADDLSRFMTGQLVASHRYSVGERLARFVRKHRALVITIAAAATAIAVVAWLAVQRVLSARDEAVAQARAAEIARAREAERATDLTVSQARLLLATNPTAALAMVQPLAATARWRDVRAIAAGARASGLAWRLPGSPSTTSIDLSPDGMALLACGSDGAIRVHDLATRATTIAASVSPGAIRCTFVDSRHFVTWRDRTLTAITLDAPAANVTYEHPSKLAHVVTGAGHAFAIDAEHRAWRLDLASGSASPLEIADAIKTLAVSPDGRWLAVGGETHLWLMPAAGGTVEKLATEVIHELAWATSEPRFVAVGKRAILEVTVAPKRTVVPSDTYNGMATLAAGQLHSAGLNGRRVDGRALRSSDLYSSLLGLDLARGELVVGAAPNAIQVFDRTRWIDIAVPAAPIQAIVASPASPYVVAVCRGMIFVWNLDDVFARKIAVPEYTHIAVFGARETWSMSSQGPAKRIDLLAGTTSDVATLGSVRYNAPASGAYVVLRPVGNKTTVVVRRGGEPETLPLESTQAVALDDQHVVVGTTDRKLVVYELATKRSTVLGAYPEAIDRISIREAAPRWIVAVTKDGGVVRHDRTTGTATETRLARTRDPFVRLAACSGATSDGRVFLAAGPILRTWAPDGSLVDHATLPRPITGIYVLDDRRALVSTDDERGFIVDLALRDRFKPTSSMGSGFTITRDNELAVFDDRTTGATVIDLEANAAWKIAHSVQTGSSAAITSDGRFVVMRDPAGIAVWLLDLPRSPLETARWLHGLTNARYDTTTGAVTWPDL